MEGEQPAGKGGIDLDPDADTKEFDFLDRAGPQSATTARGIYRIKGASLTMCLGGERRFEFSGAGEAALVELTHIA